MIVTLRNRGGESYKQDEYGDKVVVHRTIRDDGTTTYKIKGAHGTYISYAYTHIHVCTWDGYVY